VKHIILFDGVCNLCDWSVQFIIKRDPQAVFQFASLQSDKGQELKTAFNIDPEEDSIILIRADGKVFLRSAAALQICRLLKGPVKILKTLIIVPAGLRDFAYRHIAVNRYRFFGKKEACRLPTKEERARFLD
jgi:predicted DCC family thiol-disulfide oxidoreductase YuxK